jgi:DNA repair protein RadC
MLMKNVNMPSTSIKNWAPDDQPREKLLQLGSSALSNAELLAILIRTGTRESSALEIARQLLKKSSDNLQEMGKLSISDIKKIKGMGFTKSITLMAALELGRRRSNSTSIERVTIKSSNDVAHFLTIKLKDLSYEVFAVLLLNRANKIIHFEIISRGGITGTIADPRLILKLAIENNATGLILCHNHPSGNLQPSKADKDITEKIIKSASLLDIKILDHLIVSDEGYFSFLDEGLM